MPNRSGQPTSATDSEARLLALLYETVGQPDGWRIFLDALQQSYPGGLAMLGLNDPGLLNGRADATGPCDPAFVARYNRHYAARSPWIPRMPMRRIGEVTDAEFLVPRADLTGTEFYQDFLRPERLDHAVGVTLQQDGTRCMVVSVLFPAATAERDGETVGRLQRLSPHLKRVAQINRQLAETEIRALSAERALDRLATAMLVVSASAQVAHLNLAAERMVAAGDGLTLVHNVLGAVNPRDDVGLRQLIASAVRATREIAAAPGGVMRIARRSGRAPYEVLVAPLAPGAADVGLSFSSPRAAIFVRDPETQAASPLDWLQRLYGLTAAEARLMQALLGGDTLETIAERIGVAKGTLRTQLKAIFAKTGTSRQAELVRLGLRGLAAFAR